MADVSGKGVPAALFMMISKTLLKSAAQSGLSPKAVLEKVNDQLCENNDAEMFVTVWLGILEISTGKMKCANAGHEYPAIMRKGGSFELFKDRHGSCWPAWRAPVPGIRAGAGRGRPSGGLHGRRAGGHECLQHALRD